MTKFVPISACFMIKNVYLKWELTEQSWLQIVQSFFNTAITKWCCYFYYYHVWEGLILFARGPLSPDTWCLVDDLYYGNNWQDMTGWQTTSQSSGRGRASPLCPARCWVSPPGWTTPSPPHLDPPLQVSVRCLECLDCWMWLESCLTSSCIMFTVIPLSVLIF